MANVIIFGIGPSAETAYFYLTHDSEHKIVAFTVDHPYLDRSSFHGLPVVAFENIETLYSPLDYQMYVSLNYRRYNKTRAQKFYEAKQKGYSLISYISSKAHYYNTPIGENCFIFENNIIQPYTTIGDNCIIWSSNMIAHHTQIGNHCFLSSNVVIAGSVIVGDYTFFGINATVGDNIKIGTHNIIGAGSLILSNTEDGDCFIAQETKKKKFRYKDRKF